MVRSPFYYRAVMALLKPLYWLKLQLFRWNKPPLKGEIAQRFGRNYPTKNTDKPIIWCHAVSLGETNTAEPLLRELLAQGYALWITNTTHTGFARVEQLFEKEIIQGDVYHSFVPVDNEKVIHSFIRHVQPVAGLFIETELWATTLAILADLHIPSILVNGRLSEKSFKGYQKVAKVSQSMMENLDLIIAQDGDSAKRFRQLGATSDKIRVASSLKWSSQVNPIMFAKASTIKQEWQLEDRTVLVAGSTHEGEEEAILQTFKQLQSRFSYKNLLLIVVPRHPERFDAVANLLESHQYVIARRSLQQLPTKLTKVYLADSMGELGVWYMLADIAFVGGSLVNVGGHNPIESAIVATPIIMGKYTQSCQQVVNQLKHVGALIQVNHSDELTEAFSQWLTNPEQAKQGGRAGQQLAENYQNATGQQVAMIQTILQPNQMKN